jgi:hypothetical protein
VGYGSLDWRVIPYAIRIAKDGQDLKMSRLFYNDEFRGPKPDIAINKADLRYVSGYIFPFHYKHPVTGQETSENVRNSRLKPVKTN